MSALVFVVAFFIVAVLVYMARYSGRLRVSETRIIAAPIADIYARVADFNCWSEWSPWLEHEADTPVTHVTLSDRTDGESSSYAWDSIRIGDGEILHLRMEAGEKIEQRMNFKQPFRIRGRGYWEFRESGAKTEVTWRMNGRVSFPLRAFSPTVQGMIALDFKYGLDRLASLVEPPDAPRYSLAYLGVRDIPASRYAYKTYSGPINGLGKARQLAFAELRGQVEGQGVLPYASPIAVYIRTNVKLRTTVCHMGIPVGIPVGDTNLEAAAVRDLPAHSAYVVRLQGDHSALEVAWYQAMQRMRRENIQPDQSLPPFERYLDAESVTELHIPVRQPI